MHELSLAQALLDHLEREIGNHRVERLVSLTVRIGRLRGVIPESFVFCMGVLLAKNPVTAGAEVRVVEEPVRCRCLDCGRESTLDDVFPRCLDCHSRNVQVTTGKELTFLSMEVEP